MNRVRLLISLFLFGMIASNAQVKQLSSKNLNISYDKTLHLVFEKNVKSVDGTQDIVASLIPEVPNIVKVRVENEGFLGQRSLSVITADGRFHSYNLTYKDKVPYSIYYDNKASSDTIEGMNVNVSMEKHTHLLFPSKIIYSEVGNEESASCETVSGSSNILKVHSLTEDVNPTSLFVVTKEKRLYEFVLKSDSSANFTYNIGGRNNEAQFDALGNERLLSTMAEKCLKEKKRIYSVGQEKNQLVCYLNNVHVNNDILYFTFEIRNASNLKMNIDYIRCFIQDNKTLKNEPEQDSEIVPALTYQYKNEIEGKTRSVFVLAFQKFTIPDNKSFYVQIYDKDGGRHLSFPVRDSFIMEAKTIK